MLFCDKYTAAFAYFQHAVSIRSATLGFEHPDVAVRHEMPSNSWTFNFFS
jgi:hypothetical protein